MVYDKRPKSVLLQFTVTLVGACPQTVTPISIYLKRDPVPHHLTLFFYVIITGGHEIGAKYSSGTLLTTSGSEQYIDPPQSLSEDSV